MDFTLKTYRNLLQALKDAGYTFITARQYSETKLPEKFVILRNDVERYYPNALSFAQIQNDLNIKTSFFFRMNKCYRAEVVKEISNTEHEIGYHYDDLAFYNGNFEKAIARFKNNLTVLRKFSEVNTISKEGSPLSKFDNSLLWTKYNYKDFGIDSDIDSDIDFSEVFYLTETGRRWNGYNVSIRDKVEEQQQIWNEQGYNYRSSNDIIQAIKNNTFPDKVLMTFHPQRWHERNFLWLKELVFQNVKNIAKWVLVKYRS